MQHVIFGEQLAICCVQVFSMQVDNTGIRVYRWNATNTGRREAASRTA